MSTTLKERADQLAQQFGVSVEAATAAMNAFTVVADTSPRKELQWRLNERLQGRDPGQPVNWRGLP